MAGCQEQHRLTVPSRERSVCAWVAGEGRWWWRGGGKGSDRETQDRRRNRLVCGVAKLLAHVVEHGLARQWRDSSSGMACEPVGDAVALVRVAIGRNHLWAMGDLGESLVV